MPIRGREARLERARRRQRSAREKDLDARVSRDIEERGFSESLRAHLREILDIQREDKLSGDDVALQLHEWLEKDPQISAHIDRLPDRDAEALERELDGEAAEGDPLLAHASGVQDLLGFEELELDEFPDIPEGNGLPVLGYRKREFRNWGRTVRNEPGFTFFPRTRRGVQNIVTWARDRALRVRVSGYRHSWSDVFAENGGVLIALLPLKFTERLPFFEAALDRDNELQGIDFVGEIEEDGKRKGLFKLGSGTTNEMLREHLLARGRDKWDWTLPLNVIMLEITFGGSNAPICHGAGLHSKTLSDLVHELEVVNPNGEIQTISDPEQLKVAAGCFGLLGPVLSLTLKLDPMTYATMQPIDKRVALAIPPPDGFDVPPEIDMSGVSQNDIDVARQDFIHRCEKDYYSEWFWFPFQDDCWINTWKDDGAKEDAVGYPSPLKTAFQEGTTFLAHVANRTLFRLLPGRVQAKINGTAAMLGLPDGRTIVTPVADALHFQRGIQNLRVLDMELEIPIPARADEPDLPDWTIAQRAWWDAIALVYEREDTPMRLTLEMRITGGSDIVLAPQHGNRFGTCSIEVLTTPTVDDEDWQSFKQQLADRWDSYTDAQGARLNVRPHWAKEWQNLEFRGMRATEYVKTVAYADRIPEFRAGLEQIAAAGGYTVADLQQLFSNELLDDVLEHVFD